jgi:hypothetical protein
LWLGYWSEVGELAGIYKRVIRGDYSRQDALPLVEAELGDVLWYLACLDSLCRLGSLRDFNTPCPACDDDLEWQVQSLLARTVDDLARTFPRWVQICRWWELDPAAVAEANLAKLASRAERGKIRGTGGDR